MLQCHVSTVAQKGPDTKHTLERGPAPVFMPPDGGRRCMLKEVWGSLFSWMQSPISLLDAAQSYTRLNVFRFVLTYDIVLQQMCMLWRNVDLCICSVVH